MSSAETLDRLTAELEAALLRELVQSWHDLNAGHFRRKLAPLEIVVAPGRGRLGRYDPRLRTIEIARSLVLEQPWGVVLEVLKHEMAHQYVHQVMGRGCDEPAHGEAFRELCTKLGIDPRARGLPAQSALERDSRILERVSRLLALAQSGNAYEAQAAASAAQKLMLKYNLEIGLAGSRQAYAFRHLGEPKGRILESERLLSSILGEHFFVEVIWVPVYRPLERRRGQVLEICGTPANLEMAEYVHGYLEAAAERLWLEHKETSGTRSNRERRTFLAGVMEGFREKLGLESDRNREQGLVWIGDADLGTYYRKRHPHIRHVRTAGERRTAARAHGRAAGRTLVLRRSVPSGPGGGTRLLTK
jgi:predicted SprT family Zn-dependent metalloprotease